MKVFLSYSTGDYDAARRLKDALERARPGVGIFFAPQSLVAGDVWQARLADSLAESDILLLLLGRKLGPWQERECQEAQRLQLLTGRGGRPRIVPVALGNDAVLPGFVGLLHTIAAPLPDHDDAIAAIVSALDRAPTGEATPDWTRANPYKGLASLAPSDAPFFFGREAKTAEVLQRIREQPNKVLVLVGNSGVGKSSLMQAGVIDALRTQRWPGAAAHEPEHWTAGLADSHRWTSLSFRPGEEPLQALALAFVALTEKSGADRDEESTKWVKRFLDGTPLHRLAAHTVERLSDTGNEPPKRFLIYVDQGEELYARSATAQRALFSALLAKAATRPEFVVLMSLRADYYGRLQEDATLFNASLRLDLPPMTPDELAQAIGRPAARLGVRFETDDAPGRLAKAVADHPGALPLLSDLLADLWRDMRGRNDATLRWSHRMELVDVSATLRQRADKFLADDPAREAPTRRLFTLRLAHTPTQGEPVRRRARRGECDDTEWAIAETLADQDWRLLSLGVDPASGESTAEVAHEQLLRSWPTLRQWLDDAREFLVWRGTLEQDRRDWEEAGKPNAALLLGQRLVRARYWMGEREGDLAPDDLVYIDASEAHDRIEREARQLAEERRLRAEAERQEAEAARLANNKRWLRAGAIGVGVATLVVAGFAALLFDLRATVRQQEVDAAALAAHAKVQEKLANTEATKARNQERLAKKQGKLFEDQRQIAREQERRAQGQQSLALSLLGQEQLSEGFPVTALQLALEGLPTVADRPWSPQAAGLLIAALGQHRERITLRGHELEVRTAVFSPDGTRVLTASDDKTARLWDAAGGGLLAVLSGHTGPVRGAVFSPDGKHVLTMSDDRTARLWNVVGGGEPVVLRGHGDQLTSAVFAADGKHVLTASRDQTARLWDAASGRELTVLRGHGHWVTSAAFSVDGAYVVTASQDGTARVWDADSGRQLAVLNGHAGAVFSAVFSPDGKRVLTASYDRTARLWDAASGQEEAVLRGHENAVASAVFSPDGKRVLTAPSWSGAPRLWDAASSREIAALRGHNGSVYSAVFSADGTRVLTAGWDRTARLSDAMSGRQLIVLQGHSSTVNSAVFSRDGTRVLTASLDRTARLWAVADGEELPSVKNPARVNDAAFSADGARVLAVLDNSTARLQETRTGTELFLLREHTDSINSAVFSPDNTRILTASSDETARLWEASTGRRLAVLRGHQSSVLSAVFSPDGSRILTASSDHTARLWHTATGQQQTVLRGHESSVFRAQFSPDGARIITVSMDRTARIWDVTSGRQLAVLRGHSNWVVGAAFSPDGSQILTASQDKTARLWDAASGRELAVLREHTSGVSEVAFTADGQRVLTASHDGKTRIWEAAEGRLLATLTGHDESVLSATFSPDGLRVLTASKDRTVRLWETLRGQQLAVLHGHEYAVNFAKFSPDGTRMLSGSDDGTWRLWLHIRSMSQLIEYACARLPRPMSLEERRKYFLEVDPKQLACGWHPDRQEKPPYTLPTHLR